MRPIRIFAAVTYGLVLCAPFFSASADDVFPPGQAQSKATEALLRAQAAKQEKDAADAAKSTGTKTTTDTKTGPKGSN